MIYVVVPNYTVSDDLKGMVIDALTSMKADEVFLVVVDDGSPMDTSFLDEYADKVIRNKENMGFAPSCNKGFEWVLERDDCNFIICANNDIEVYPGWLEALIEPFSDYENVAITGLVSCKDKEIAKNYNNPRITEGGQLGEWMQSGGLWATTPEVLEKIGLFDEQFERGGYEDVDIFLRARDTFGMKIIMSSKSMFWHKEGATRWESNDYVENFPHLMKSTENNNRKKFADKWGFDYYSRSVWKTKDLFNI